MMSVHYLGDCSSVYLDGTETGRSDRVVVSVNLQGSSSVVAGFGVRVWFPDLPLTLWLSDTELNRVNGWTSSSDCNTFEYQRARVSTYAVFRSSADSISFTADVTPLVEVTTSHSIEL